MILVKEKERQRFFKFATVGMIGSFVDLGVMNLLTRLFAMPLVVAGSLSFVCAVSNNFTLNRRWTYPDSRSRPIAHQLGMYFFVSTIGICIRLPILKFVEPVMEGVIENSIHVAHGLTVTLAKNTTLIIAIGIVMLWNFFVNRYWTYNDVD